MERTPFKRFPNVNRTAFGLFSTRKKNQPEPERPTLASTMGRVAEEKTPKRMCAEQVWRDRELRVEGTRHFRRNRIRIIDWFSEVFTVFELGWEAYWMCLELFDSLLAEYQVVSLSNFSLVSMACVLIVSKFVNIHPVTAKQVADSLSHGSKSERQIIQMEERILQVIFQSGALERSTPYCWLVEEYNWVEEEKLQEALRWMVVAWSHPRLTVRLGARTYRQLVDLCLTQTGREQLVMASNEDRETLGVRYLMDNYKQMTFSK